ncbi:acylphosphatase [Pontibacillus salicampi]|uniref:Acylphosphatase n=1 Tax=Pontibacillus salicampi TaxID=1449801 RepID=A0ABV6LLL0_9BACI
MRHVHMIVTGKVQGVGFRFSTQQKALEHNVSGWVRNKMDGSVEVEAEGEDKDVESFINALHQGPSPYAKVDDIDMDESSNVEGYTSFTVK